MELVVFLGIYSLGCIIFLIYAHTPWGKKRLKF